MQRTNTRLGAVVLLTLVCLFPIAVHAASVSVDVWLSGPYDAWDAAIKADKTGVINLIQQDFEAAIGGSATVSVTELVAEDTPRLGSMATTTVSDGGDEAAVKSKLLGAVMTNVQTAIPNTVVKVLPFTKPTVGVWLETVVNGSSLVWEEVLDQSAPEAVAAVSNDLQAAVDSSLDKYLVQVTATGAAGENVSINASGLVVPYKVWQLGSTAVDPVAASGAVQNSTLSILNAYMNSVESAYPQYADFFGPVRPYVPLPVEEAAVSKVVKNYTSQHTLKFSGEASDWAVVLNSEGTRATLVAAVESAVEAALERGAFTTTATVTGLRTGSLLADVTVVQGATASAIHPYASDEANSVLSDTTLYSAVYALYPGSVTAALLAVMDPTQGGNQCGSYCVGMIAMGSAVGFLTLFCVVVAILRVGCRKTAGEVRQSRRKKVGRIEDSDRDTTAGMHSEGALRSPATQQQETYPQLEPTPQQPEGYYQQPEPTPQQPEGYYQQPEPTPQQPVV